MLIPFGWKLIFNYTFDSSNLAHRFIGVLVDFVYLFLDCNGEQYNSSVFDDAILFLLFLT